MDNVQTKRLGKSPARVAGILVCAFAVVLSVALAGCGGGPKNLEEYVKTDEGKEMIEEAKASADMGDMATIDIAVEGNNIIYNVTFTMTFDTNPIADGVFDDDTISELSEAISDMEKDTGLSGVTMEYVFKDSAGTVLYQTKVDDKGLVQ